MPLHILLLSVVVPLALLFGGLVLAVVLLERRVATRRCATAARLQAALDEFEDRMRAEAAVMVEDRHRFDTGGAQLDVSGVELEAYWPGPLNRVR